MAEIPAPGGAEIRSLILAADGARVGAALGPLATTFLTNADIAVIAGTVLARAFIGRSDAENQALALSVLAYARLVATEEEAQGAVPPPDVGGMGTLTGDATVIRAPGNEYLDGEANVVPLVQPGGGV